jgi:hypothetical protein
MGNATSVRKYRDASEFTGQYNSGVSLHSHTMHSREYLGRLPGYISKVPVVSFIVEREIGRLHLYTGRCLDFKKFYWTPPLSAREAYELEQRQIAERLGLQPLVSLTDHDTVEAGLHLRMLPATADVPVSVEWSVPCEGTVFHLGVHNLRAAQALEWMSEFARFSANPNARRLRELFCELNADPSVLLVLNHPYWDADGGAAAERHESALWSFLQKWRHSIHALELNGLRSRKENETVMRLGEAIHLPVISGGDRHGCEPNATLNVTRATTFEEFVSEVRVEKRSEMVLMPQYFEPLRIRLLENAWHALSDAPGEFGRRHWMTRVFISDEKGSPQPLSAFTGTRTQMIIDRLRWVMGLLASPQMRPILRMTFLGQEEGGL